MIIKEEVFIVGIRDEKGMLKTKEIDYLSIKIVRIN